MVEAPQSRRCLGGLWIQHLITELFSEPPGVTTSESEQKRSRLVFTDAARRPIQERHESAQDHDRLSKWIRRTR